MITSEVLLKKKKKQKKLVLIFSILSIVIITLLAVFFYYNKNQNNYMDVGEAKRGPIVDAVYGLGTVTAVNTYQLKLGVTGKIGDLYVEEGQKVKKEINFYRFLVKQLFMPHFLE